MTPRNRFSLSTLTLLALASVLRAGDFQSRVPGIAPARSAALPAGIAAPPLGPQGLSTVSTLIAPAARVGLGFPQAAQAAATANLNFSALPALAASPLAPRALGAPAASAVFTPGLPAAAQQAGEGDIARTLGEQSAEVARALDADPSGLSAGAGLNNIFFGDRPGAGAGSRQGSAPKDGFIVNDEGVKINGRAARYYREIKRLQAALSPLDLDETLDVMDDTYADVWVKLAAVEAIAKQRHIAETNVHLEDTLTFVDGLLEDGDRNIAVHTHRVFFHKADNAASEISEGIRRVDAYLKQSERHFGPSGDAEKALKVPLHEVQLAFDTRGYDEIKAHLRQREAEFQKTYGDRFKFSYVDELAPIPEGLEKVRAAYNVMVEKYKAQPKGLQKIIEGVTYSRYVGILLELKALEYKLQRGYTVLQSGRDLFGADGKYVTEGDGVVRSPEGEFEWIEAKSARVSLPPEEALQDKVIYKLEVYKKHLALLERTVGGKLKFVFAFDVGGRDPQAARQGVLVWKDEKQRELMEYLEAQAPILSQRYGFPVSFLFLNSQPGEDPLLYQQKAVDAEQWAASQASGGAGKPSKRKHGGARR